MVQKWVLSIIKFWLEKGVDGFRLDTANYFFHDKKFRNNPALSNKKINSNPYYQQELKYSINQKENLIFMKALRKVTNRYKDIVMIGEIADPKIQAEYTSDNNKLHMAYSFELLRENFSNTLIQNTVLDFLKIQKVDGLAGAFLITTYQDMFQDGQTQKFMNIILPSLLAQYYCL